MFVVQLIAFRINSSDFSICLIDTAVIKLLKKFARMLWSPIV